MWCNELGLSVNPDKTGLVAFTRRRKLPGFFEPRLFGMTWREHVDVKVRKAHSLFWACRRANGVAWGLRPRVVHWLYISIVRPSITFSSLGQVAWLSDSATKKLSRVQGLACLGIMGAMRTTLTSAVEALVCFLPPELVVQCVVRSATHRLECGKLHPNQTQ
jgi:hypothetical protein